jgi:hypothetical protein
VKEEPEWMVPAANRHCFALPAIRMTIWASPAMEESRNDPTVMTAPLTVIIEWSVEGTGNSVKEADYDAFYRYPRS